MIGKAGMWHELTARRLRFPSLLAGPAAQPADYIRFHRVNRFSHFQDLILDMQEKDGAQNQIACISPLPQWLVV